jgi:chemotaxis protein MotB
MLVVLCLLACASFAEASGVTSEQIYFLEEDGLHAMVYTTSRSDYSNYNMWFKSKETYHPEDYIKDFLYIYPDEYTWDNTSKSGYTLLKLPGRSFASMERVALGDNLEVTENGVYTFINRQNEETTPNGHYGLWNSPGNFESIAYSWVFPANLKPVEYKANREGRWVQRHNTITYYGSNVNDLEFEIVYRPSGHATYEALKRQLENEKQIRIEQEANRVKVTMATKLLYPSGVAVLSDKGKSILSKIAEILKERKNVNVIVEGHTDNVPISPNLASTFATNWELSSARSINVVHFLVEDGVEESRFESRALSFQRPIASNDTEEGKAKNRRIELFFEEGGLDK